MKIFTAKS
jgi:hypothetical protein